MWQDKYVVLVGDRPLKSADQQMKVLAFIKALKHGSLDGGALYVLAGNIDEQKAISQAAADASSFPLAIWYTTRQAEKQVRLAISNGELLSLGVITAPLIDEVNQITQAQSLTIIKMGMTESDKVGDDEGDDEGREEIASGTPSEDDEGITEEAGQVPVEEETPVKTVRASDLPDLGAPAIPKNHREGPPEPQRSQAKALNLQVKRKAIISSLSLSSFNPLKIKVEVASAVGDTHRGEMVNLAVYSKETEIEPNTPVSYVVPARIGGVTEVDIPIRPGQEFVYVSLQVEPPAGDMVQVQYDGKTSIPVAKGASSIEVTFGKPTAPSSVLPKERILIKWPVTAENGPANAAAVVAGILNMGSIKQTTSTSVPAGGTGALQWEISDLSPGRYDIRLQGFGKSKVEEAQLSVAVVAALGGRVSTTMARIYGNLLVTGYAINRIVEQMRRELIMADMPHQIIDLTGYGLPHATPVAEADDTSHLVIYAVTPHSDDFPNKGYHSILVTGTGHQPVDHSLLAKIQELNGAKYIISPDESDLPNLDGWSFLKHHWPHQENGNRRVLSLFGGKKEPEESILKYVVLREDHNE